MLGGLVDTFANDIQGDILCRFISSSDSMKHFGQVIRKLKYPVIELIGSNYGTWELDDDIITKMEEQGRFQLPIQVNLSEFSATVDIRLVVDGLGEESISGFPMKLNSESGTDT